MTFAFIKEENPGKVILEEEVKAGLGLTWQAEQHRRKGELDIAETLYKQALEKDPLNVGCMENLSRIYISSGDLRAAENLWRQAGDYLTSRRWFYLAKMAEIYETNNFPQETEALLVEAIENDSRNPLAMESLAGFYERRNDLPAAESRYEDAVVVAPNRPFPYFGLARVRWGQQEFGNALWALERGYKTGAFFGHWEADAVEWAASHILDLERTIITIPLLIVHLLQRWAAVIQVAMNAFELVVQPFRTIRLQPAVAAPTRAQIQGVALTSQRAYQAVLARPRRGGMGVSRGIRNRGGGVVPTRGTAVVRTRGAVLGRGEVGAIPVAEQALEEQSVSFAIEEAPQIDEKHHLKVRLSASDTEAVPRGALAFIALRTMNVIVEFEPVQVEEPGKIHVSADLSPLELGTGTLLPEALDIMVMPPSM
jgi:hypothetical protein